MQKIKIKISDGDFIADKNQQSNTDKKISDINIAEFKQSEKNLQNKSSKLIFIFLFFAIVIALMTTTKTRQNAATAIFGLNSKNDFYSEKLRQNFPEIDVLKDAIKNDILIKTENIINKGKIAIDQQYFNDNQIAIKFADENAKKETLNLIEDIEQILRQKYVITGDFYRQTPITAVKNQPQETEIKIYCAAINDYLIISKKLSELEKTIEILTKK